MRLSDADRERLYELLARHAAAGRITIEELERRVAVAAGAKRARRRPLCSTTCRRSPDGANAVVTWTAGRRGGPPCGGLAADERALP